MADRHLDGGEWGFAKECLKDCRRGQRGQNGRIGLDHRGLLALGQEGALGVAVVLFEEVVDQVRRERDQVGKEEPRRQSA